MDTPKRTTATAGTCQSQAARTPERWAVVRGEERLSYGELMAASTRLAAELRARGVGAERLVGILMERPLELPVGTVLSKTFWYPREAGGTVRIDRAAAVTGRRRIETRLLVRGTAGWAALPYLWNDPRTEAFLRPAGALVALRWSDGGTRRGELDYLVPNRDQCGGCHADGRGGLRPIGPTAANLNREIPVAGGSLDQLSLWKRRGLLPADAPVSAGASRMPVWDDPATGSVTERARAYLEVQCAHCHDPARPADASGLLLGWAESRPRALGVCKPPVAAGRGSGGLLYDVVPGRPGESILVHRMRSREPDVQMPELGRDLRHDEGLALVEEWIAGLGGDCAEPALPQRVG